MIIQATAERFYLLLAGGSGHSPHPRFLIYASASARDGVNLDKEEKLSEKTSKSRRAILAWGHLLPYTYSQNGENDPQTFAELFLNQCLLEELQTSRFGEASQNDNGIQGLNSAIIL